MAKFPGKIESSNPKEFAIANADEMAGGRSVATIADLYKIPVAILSKSKGATPTDAEGQRWYVISERKEYRLINLAQHGYASGWSVVVDGDSFQPIIIERLVDGVIYKAGQSTTADGEKVFDLKSGMFLWEVKRVNGFITSVEYYQNKVGDLSVGGYPQQGRIYIHSNRTFIGVADGLCELFKGTIVPPEPPTPPTEEFITGGGAADTVFFGVIGGGGADEGYFDVK